MRARIGLLLLAATVACDPTGGSQPEQPTTSAEDTTAQDAQMPAQSVLAAGASQTPPPLASPDDELPPDQPVPEPDPVDVEAPAEPAVPTPPWDYGLIHPPEPAPAPEDLTLHAVAGYEVVAIYAKPDVDAARLGYLRIGTRLEVTEKVEGTGCSKGWHALMGGGYACASRGLLVDKKPPYLNIEPPPPNTESAFPYEYAYVRKWNTPMWWRVPTAEELSFADDKRKELEAIREGKPVPSAKPAAPAKPPAPETPAAPKKADDVNEDAGDLSKLPGPDGTTPAAPDEPKPAAEESAEPPAPAPEPEPEIDLPLNPETPWLEKGFFISLAGQFTEDGYGWWKTARGGFVPTSAARKYAAKDFSGQVLSEDTEFPFGYAMAKETKVYELGDDGKLSVVDKLERRTFVDLALETIIHDQRYMILMDGRLVRTKDLRLAEARELPAGLQEWERWVDVDLSKQMLVAYEGVRPVYVTLVSTGKKGTKEEPFDTPTGRWRIRSKHISTTMDGGSATDGNYSIQDVPWTMFFKDSYALHGAFWHESFGRVRSHGCVNLGPSDARWLFTWTTPFLPEGWHGVHAHDGSPGSTVIVRE